MIWYPRIIWCNPIYYTYTDEAHGLDMSMFYCFYSSIVSTRYYISLWCMIWWCDIYITHSVITTLSSNSLCEAITILLTMSPLGVVVLMSPLGPKIITMRPSRTVINFLCLLHCQVVCASGSLIHSWASLPAWAWVKVRKDWGPS